jgi:predicted RNA-binding protein with PUA-like domain
LRDQIQVGDEAFFYHSSCAVPAIAGTVKVVRDGYPDPTAFNKKSSYYDPKTDQEHPRWYCVDVQLLQKFKKPITLAELKTHHELQDMPLLKKGNRLSIVPVTKREWQFILALQND